MTEDTGVDAPAARSVLRDAGDIDREDLHPVHDEYESPSADAAPPSARHRRNVIDAGRAYCVRNGLDVHPTAIRDAVNATTDAELEAIADNVYTSLCRARNGQLGVDAGTTDVADCQRLRERIALACLRRQTTT